MSYNPNSSMSLISALQPQNEALTMGLFGILTRSTVDLTMGGLISFVSEKLFSNSWLDLVPSKDCSENTGNSILIKKMARVWLQMAFTALVSVEVRSMYASSADTIDPLGGLLFILAVSQQPKFWERFKDLKESVYSRFIYKIDTEAQQST